MKYLMTFTALAVLSTAAFAQSPDDTASSPFDQLDADRSGGISKEEAQAHPTVAQAFSDADANGDGIITREEFGAAFTVAQPPATPPASE